MITENVSILKINKLTKAQYERELAAGNISETELYLTPDEEITLSDLGVTASATELNKLDGITATTAELNILDGVTATTAELNYLDGVTSNVQTQLDEHQHFKLLPDYGDETYYVAYVQDSSTLDYYFRPNLTTDSREATCNLGGATRSWNNVFANSLGTFDAPIDSIYFDAIYGSQSKKDVDIVYYTGGSINFGYYTSDGTSTYGLYYNYSDGLILSYGDLVLEDGNISVAGSLTVNDTSVSLDGHTHGNVTNSDGTGKISLILDSDYYYFRPYEASKIINGSSARPWYKTYTERLEVTEERPIFLPTYSNTVSYATNCYVSSTGLLSRTTNTSSKTIKHDIKLLANDDLMAEKLYDVGIYQFKYNDDIITDVEDSRYNKDLVGFIIEDLYEKYPIAVDTPSDNVQEWTWNQQYLIPPMLKLIQNQKEEIDALKEDIEALKALI